MAAFVDEARVFVKAGNGGKGCESFYSDKITRYPRPDGGDGGKGGDVVFTATRSLQTLLDYKFRQHHQAKKGGIGGSKGKKGRTGEDCVLRVPMGTVIRDGDTGLLIRDLTQDGQEVVVAKGGAGGIGNNHNKAPKPPGEGEERTILLELKTVADVGLIGFPNAGKSTLICGVSKVRSKIASYAFTTKQPILGFVGDGSGEFDFVVADLPGLIEGAHTGKGLGDRFLRHAERTRLLVHVVDMAATEGRDPLEDFETINHELEAYNPRLSLKKQLVVANKMDLPGAEGHLNRFRKKYPQEKVLAASALEQIGLQEIIKEIKGLLCQGSSLDQ